MRSKKTEEHLVRIAKKYNISVNQMREIAEAPFRLLLKITSESDRDNLIFDSLRIINWGVFAVKKGRLEHFKKLKNDKQKSQD